MTSWGSEVRVFSIAPFIGSILKPKEPTIYRRKPAESYNLIAPLYDVLNDLSSLGFHRYWRKKICEQIDFFSPKCGRILDIATGTGDVVFEVLNKRSDLEFHAIDASYKMIEIAQKKLKKGYPLVQNQVFFLLADGTALPYCDSYFDSVSVAWGFKNLQPFSLGCREILRVLKPGGHCFVLERSQAFFSLQQGCGQLLSSVPQKFSAKLNLPFLKLQSPHGQELRTFPYGKNLVADFFDAGFIDVKFKMLLGGVVYLYFLTKPSK
ncbi:MAG: class I SAM-dependent methyltransferase [Silvanigrellaceae bacterium]|nr:class I SAM-dependent methyltransferase [Silvanigrellaceae bacterium]